jgi:septal ring factor EnvC (AmiA/AmiB activator)
MKPLSATTRESKTVENRFEIVNDETISLIDADAFTLMSWQQAAVDAETKAKLVELADARRSQNDAQVRLQVLDQDYTRAAEEQARVRDNLQAVGEGDTKNRFDKQLNVLEDRLGSIEGQRVEQRKVLDDFTAKVGNIIRTF